MGKIGNAAEDDGGTHQARVQRVQPDRLGDRPKFLCREQGKLPDIPDLGSSLWVEVGDARTGRPVQSLVPRTGIARKAEVEQSGEQVLDKRTGQPQNKLPDPPMRGPIGAYIYAHFGQTTWNEWIGMGTKVINELRLDFSNPAHQDTYEQHMLEWLGVTKDEVEAFVGSEAG